MQNVTMKVLIEKSSSNTSLLVLRKISIASRNLVDKPVARRKANFRSRKYLHWPNRIQGWAKVFRLFFLS